MTEIPHFSAIAAFALCVSVVFALTTKESVKDRLRYGVFVFVSFLAVALAIGWIMLPFPR